MYDLLTKEKQMQIVNKGDVNKMKKRWFLNVVL